MRLYNGKITKRQGFRIGLLENITLGIVIVPYITARAAGRWHMAAFACGVVLVLGYSMIIYAFSKAFPEGMIEEMDHNMGNAGRAFDLIYAIRYMLKASIILLFAASIIREYLLRSFNLWWIIISFAVICGYGASKDIEKRGRLLELLFWWMLVPLICVAVFSISNVNWSIAAVDVPADMRGILLGGYEMLLVMSSIELMLFTLTKQDSNNWRDALKTLIYIIVSVLFAYILVQGILGEAWTGSSIRSTLHAMQAAKIPGGGIERFDYAVMAFWIIGVFAVISGFMFYAKEFLRVCFSKRWNSYEHDKTVETVSDKWWIIALVVCVVIGLCRCFSYREFGEIFYHYLMTFDIGLSLLIPAIVYISKQVRLRIVKSYKISRKLSGSDNAVEMSLGKAAKLKRYINLFLICALSVLLLSGCERRVGFVAIDDRQASLETMDYAVSMTVVCGTGFNENGHDDRYDVTFEVADLTDYKGDSKRLLSTEECTVSAASLDEALELYYEANGQHINLGHLDKLYLFGLNRNECFDELLTELKEMPSITKTVDTIYHFDDEEGELTLLALIKKRYEREEL